MRLRSRNPGFAHRYRPSTEVERSVELGLRNACNTADWRDRREAQRGEHLRRLRERWVASRAPE